MLLRFLFVFALCAGAARAADASLLDGTVVQTIDLPIPDAAHQGVSGILGMNLPLAGADLVGKGSAADVAAVAAALAKDDPDAAADGPFPGAGYRVVVQLRNGVLVVLLQPMRPRAFVGQEVRIVGSGRAARAVARETLPTT